MRAGKLRYQLELQEPVRTDNAIGEQTITWRTVALLWAAIRPLSSREVLLAAQAKLQTTHEITVRWHPQVTSDKRFKLGTRTFNILGVVNVDELDVEMRVTASENTRG